jgi:hypothetical protein
MQPRLQGIGEDRKAENLPATGAYSHPLILVSRGNLREDLRRVIAFPDMTLAHNTIFTKYE